MPLSVRCLCAQCSGFGRADLDTAFAAPVRVAPEALIFPSSGVYNVDALLAGNDARWNAGGPYGMPVTVTYSFMQSVPGYYASGEVNGFQPFNAAMVTAVRAALSAYQAIADITFVEVSDAGAGGQIRFGSSMLSGNIAGYAYYPSRSELGGDVWLDTGDATNLNPVPGSYGYLTLLHEVGHALGLKHPGNYGSGDPPYLSSHLDNTDQTVMSYNTGTVSHPSWLGPLDVQAIEFLYGPKTAKTIGVLQAGTEGPDRLVGDAADNSLHGRGGDDVIFGGGGNDGVMGGAGNDWIQGDGGNDTLYGNQGMDTILGGDGADTVFGGQGDDWIEGNAGADVLYGNMGNDLIVGGSGSDTLFGGQGDDVLYGGDQVDWLFGNLGNDTMVGGAGNDYFYATPGGGHDVITDFQVGGDWLMIARNINGSGINGISDVVARATDISGGVVIDLGANNTITLLGVSRSALSGWDIVVYG